MEQTVLFHLEEIIPGFVGVYSQKRIPLEEVTYRQMLQEAGQIDRENDDILTRQETERGHPSGLVAQYCQSGEWKNFTYRSKTVFFRNQHDVKQVLAELQKLASKQDNT